MHRRQIFMYALFLLLAVTICQVSAWSAHTIDRRIPGFHAVRRLPRSMTAGSTYEWELSFLNPKSESGFANVTLEITEEKTLIGLKEFSVKGTLEAYDNLPRRHCYSTITFKETKGGIFRSQIRVEKRFNQITLRISSVPNLMPGTYTFALTVTLWYKK